MQRDTHFPHRLAGDHRGLFTLFQDITFIESCRNLKAEEVGQYVQEMLSAS